MTDILGTVILMIILVAVIIVAPTIHLTGVLEVTYKDGECEEFEVPFWGYFFKGGHLYIKTNEDYNCIAIPWNEIERVTWTETEGEQ